MATQLKVTHFEPPEPLAVPRPSIPRPALATEDLPTGELLRQSLDDARELIRLELELARREIRADVAQLRWAGVLIGVATLLVSVALSLLAVAVVIAFGATAVAALIVAGCVLLIALAAGFWGYRMLPKQPLARTRARLASDVRTLKGHVK